MSIDEMQNQIHETYGRECMHQGMLAKPAQSTGSIMMDYLLDGGIEPGTFAMFKGAQGSNKTTTLLRCIAAAQRRGERCALMTIEAGCNRKYATMWGVDVDALTIIEGLPNGEAYGDALINLLRLGYDMVGVDSITAMSPQEEMEKSLLQQTMALQARMFSRLARKLQMINRKTKVIFLSQVRAKPNPQGLPLTTPSGGAAFAHLCDYIVDFKLMDRFNAKMEIIKEDLKDEDRTEDITGSTARVYIEKMRRGAGNRCGKMYFGHHTGKLDDVGELLSVAVKLGTITKDGGWYKWQDKSYYAKDLKALFTSEPDTINTLLAQIYKNYGTEDVNGIWMG